MAKRFKDVPNVPFAPVAAVLFALVVTALMFATPAWRLERLVTLTGLADIFSPARPPLGDTARTLMALAAGAVTFLVLWAILRPIEKIIHNRKKSPIARSYSFGKREVQAEALPSGTVSTRKPIFAADDLGAPLMSDAALSSGEELFLDSAMIDSPEKVGNIEDTMRPAEAVDAVFDLRDFELAAAAPSKEDVPIILEAPEPVEIKLVAPEPESAEPETVIEWLTPAQVADPQPLVDAAAPPAANNFAASANEPADEPAHLEGPVQSSSDLNAAQVSPSPLPTWPVAAQEPTLRELLVKFEAALKRREAMAGQGGTTAPVMPEMTAQSLRDLMAAGRLR
jgi:hypothetical protein